MTTQSITKQHQVYGVGVLVVVSCIVFTTSPLLVILIIPFEAPEEFALAVFFLLKPEPEDNNEKMKFKATNIIRRSICVEIC